MKTNNITEPELIIVEGDSANSRGNAKDILPFLPLRGKIIPNVFESRFKDWEDNSESKECNNE